MRRFVNFSKKFLFHALYWWWGPQVRNHGVYQIVVMKFHGYSMGFPWVSNVPIFKVLTSLRVIDQINGEDAIKNLMKALYSWKNQWPLPVWAGLTWYQYLLYNIYNLTTVWMGTGKGSANCATASDFQNILKIHSSFKLDEQIWL